MSKNLSDFSKEKICATSDEKEKVKVSSEITNSLNEEKLKQQFEEYSAMPKTELEQKLFDEVTKSKADGTFDEKLLRDSVSKIAPYLPKEDKERLMALLDKITCRETR